MLVCATLFAKQRNEICGSQYRQCDINNQRDSILKAHAAASFLCFRIISETRSSVAWSGMQPKGKRTTILPDGETNILMLSIV
jgi:hypothetical protein